MDNLRSGPPRLFWLVVAFVVVIVLCVLVPAAVERNGQRALRASEAISQEFAESHRNYYRGRPDHASPSD